MKKIILFVVLAISLGVGTLQAQDTLWQKPAPLGNYFYNGWIDTANGHSASNQRRANAYAMARQFVTDQRDLQVYGIAAMMVSYHALVPWIPSSYYPDLKSYLNDQFPQDPSFDNCAEHLMLFQYSGASAPSMLQVGDSLPVHMLHTPVSYYVKSNTTPRNYMDTLAKPVYELYFSSPQTVHDTFFVGFTMTDGGCNGDSYYSDWQLVRPEFTCLCFYPAYGEKVAVYLQNNCSIPAGWVFRNYTDAYFIFPIIAPPDTTLPPGNPVINPLDTTVNPADTTVNPADIILADTVVVYPGNSLVLAPGSTLILQGDTLVYTGDTLVVHLGDTVDIAGHTFVLTPGDTLVVNPGDTLFVNPDGSIVLSSGGTVVILSGSGSSSGGGDDPGVAVQQADLVYRYTAVAPNPATGKVKVTSSFGISSLEAYDAQGRKVHEFRAEGCEHLKTSRYCSESIPNSEFSINLDVSSWPRGTYLLRIQTPAGPTTKKLLVQ